MTSRYGNDGTLCAAMANRKTVFMFSGQGSQYFEMGRALYEQRSTFRHWMERMDLIIRELSGCSVIDALFNQGRDKTEVFDRTMLSHPAIFMVEYAAAQTMIEAGVTPDLTLGASMGSVVAATVSGCLGWEDALSATVRQARILEARCERGGMIAILSEPALYDDDGLRGNCVIASVNFPSHFVVAAKQGRLEAIEAFLRGKRVGFARLPVSFAFHSPWIEEAKAPFEELWRSLSHQAAAIPMACCVLSETLTKLPENYLWTLAREPSRFYQTVMQLEANGPFRYIDLGPTGTLATFLKYALPPASPSTWQAALSPRDVAMESWTAVVAGPRLSGC
jgi:acyl transferase domain-containing protein